MEITLTHFCIGIVISISVIVCKNVESSFMMIRDGIWKKIVQNYL